MLEEGEINRETTSPFGKTQEHVENGEERQIKRNTKP